MKQLHVLQHTSAEYLGLIEDHLEGRNVRFQYYRPFAGKEALPHRDQVRDGLILLGGGPWGSAGARDLPTLKAEIDLAHACLMREWPVIGIGLGAQVLALAAGGKSQAEALTCDIDTAHRVRDDALGGYLPREFPLVTYLRDWALPPDYATVLARDTRERAVVWQIGRSAFGFAAHPGIKRAMIEDLIMEFEESPSDVGGKLDALRAVQRPLEDALAPIMAGLVQATGWMDDTDVG
jgi:GMP synthase-like glutamine amidotransferase